jgi:hypothetical protein
MTSAQPLKEAFTQWENLKRVLISLFVTMVYGPIVAETGNIYAGLYYPITVALITFVVGSLLLKETRHVKIWGEVGK